MTRPARPLSCRVEALEDRLAPAAPFPEFVDPHPSAGNQFGATVVALSTGNVVVTAPLDDAGGNDSGAVYLFDGATGALISTLLGSRTNDRIGSGGVTALSNGNYVIRSPEWDNGMAADAGAATFGSGTTGIDGVVSPANSLVGVSFGDQVGYAATALTNGNYVVVSPFWNNGVVGDVGAVTFGSGAAGVSGAVSTTNSLVGSTANDQVGSRSVTALTNGNYVVASPNWDNGGVANAGAATFGNGTTGIAGAVSAANSLVGSTLNDQVGSGIVTALANGNYVVTSPNWDNGAVNSAGAATFGSGVAGVTGAVSAANSLVGTTAGDQVGGNVTALTNGNYVVASFAWHNGGAANAGAATFGSGITGITGAVSAANSLVGSTAGDQVGFVTALANGNYVVHTGDWDNGGTVNVGAATFANGTTGISGTISAANSLIGTTAFDQVGNFEVIPLSNGNYLVRSPNWNNGAVADAGAVTFGSGTTGVVGVVSAGNSLVGTTADDHVGIGFAPTLTNGNYVVLSRDWDNGAVVDAGAATFGNGTTGVSGAVSPANSLVGTTAGDQVSFGGLTPLTNGNYVVRSPRWDNGAIADAGAVTLGSGTSGVVGIVSPANSLVGSTTGDQVGSDGVTPLANGNYAVGSPSWDSGAVANAGAVTFATAKGVVGTIDARNSVLGLAAGAGLQPVVVDDVNGTFFGRFQSEGNGKVRLGSQFNGFLPNPPLAVTGPPNGTVASFPASGGQYGVTPATFTPLGGAGGTLRTAVADVNGDGTPDTVAVTGPGTPIRVTVLSGADNSTVLVAPFDPFGGGFTGGGFVAAADLDGDGAAEFVVTPDEGGGPRVSIFSRNADGGTTVRANFLGIDDGNFRGGARAALGDVNGDGTPDVVVAAGFGGGPRTAVFTGQSVLAGSPARLTNDFFAFPGTDAVNLRNGSFVAAGDVTGDGFADLIFGGGPGGAPRVFILSGALVAAGDVGGAQAAPVANFFVANNSADRGGVRVAAKDVDGDGRAEVAAGSGAGSPARVRVYLGKDFTGGGEPGAVQDITVFGGAALPGGVFVG